MITRRFIKCIRSYFNELCIEAHNGISFEDFKKAAINTINRAIGLYDVKIVIFYYKYCVKHWRKIKSMFEYHLDTWWKYDYEGPTYIHVNDEELPGVITITNAIKNNYKKIYISFSELEDFGELSFRFNRYRLDSSDYFLKYSTSDAAIMRLFDDNSDFLCNIVLSESYEIFLEKNHLNYDLVVGKMNDSTKTFIGVFDRRYVESLSNPKYIDFNNMVADIEWDIMDKKSDLGVARLTIYEEVDNIDILIYFASSTFLLYKSFNDYNKRELRRIKNENRRRRLFMFAAISRMNGRM